jgi:hypothetical protein
MIVTREPIAPIGFSAIQALNWRRMSRSVLAGAASCAAAFATHSAAIAPAKIR